MAPTVVAAELALDDFAAERDKSHPTISQVWRRNWERITPFLAFPAEIRKVIYTTNAVESLNMSLDHGRRLLVSLVLDKLTIPASLVAEIIKTRGSFSNEEAALRLLLMACGNHSKKWSFVQN